MPPAKPTMNDEARRTTTVFYKLNRMIENDLHVRRGKISYKIRTHTELLQRPHDTGKIEMESPILR